MDPTPSNSFIIATTIAFFVFFETLYIFLLNALDRRLPPKRHNCHYHHPHDTIKPVDLKTIHHDLEL